MGNDKVELGIFAEGDILIQQCFWSVKKELRAPGDNEELTFTSGNPFSPGNHKIIQKKSYQKYISELNRGVMGLD